jgi:hypothetical protein
MRTEELLVNHQCTATTHETLPREWSITATDPRCTWTYWINARMLLVTRGAVARREQFPKDDRFISMQQLTEEIPARARDIADAIEHTQTH